jgi:hypothetical protein
MHLRALVAALLWLSAACTAADAQTCTPANYKTLSQILAEFETCVQQGLGAGCITVSTMYDLICSARKLTGGDYVAVSPSGSTYTPDFNTGVNFSITLVHANCPCTLANPANLQSQSGIMQIIQSASGGDTIGTYGTTYLASTVPTLSTGASNADYVPYASTPTGKIVFGTPISNAH